MRRLRIVAAVGILVTLFSIAACSPTRRLDLVKVEDQLRDLLELRTYEHIYRDVVYFGEEKSFLFVTTVDREVLFAVDIRVQAGLDLSEGITLTRDRSDGRRIYVRLPEARVLSIDADERSIHEYFLHERGGKIGLLEIGDQLEAVKKATGEDAIERGILTRAEENARRLVRNFLALAGFTEVEFSHQPRSESEQELRG